MGCCGSTATSPAKVVDESTAVNVVPSAPSATTSAKLHGAPKVVVVASKPPASAQLVEEKVGSPIVAKEVATSDGDQQRVDADPSLGNELRGVSVRHLQVDFVDAIKAAGLGRDASVTDTEPAVIRLKGANMICPRDGMLAAAYVDAVSGPEHAGFSTHMLSYTWGYLVRDIVDSLLNHCQQRKLETKSTYIWICCLCVNQHRVKELRAKGETVPFSEFEATFGSRVRRVGRVLAVFSQWDRPTYVSRVWCVYELYVATTTGGVEFDIVLPSEQEAKFFTCLSDAGAGPLWDTLKGLKVEDAQASVEDDRRRILEIVAKNPGFDELNRAVRMRIQTWFVQTASNSLRLILADTKVSTKRAEEVARISNNVAQLKDALGMHSEARELLELTLQFCKATSTEKTQGFVSTLNSLAMAAEAGGDVDEALNLYSRALDLDRELGSEETGGVATTLNNCATALEAQGDVEAAIELYDRVLKIQANTAGEETAAYAATLGNRAHAIESLGQVEEAITAFERVLAIQAKTIGTESPGYALTLSNLGHALKNQGDIERSVELYRRALAIESATIGEASPAYASTLASLAAAVAAQGDVDEAIRLYQQLLRLQDEASPAAAPVLASLAALKHGRGEEEEAAHLYERALKIQGAKVSKHSPDYAIWAFNLGRIFESLEEWRRALDWFRAADAAERAQNAHNAQGEGDADATTEEAIERVREEAEKAPESVTFVREITPESAQTPVSPKAPGATARKAFKDDAT